MSPWIRYSLLAVALAAATTAFAALAAQPSVKPDISLASPAIRTLQARMETRFDTHLRLPFELGALGFTRDGLVEVRDASKVPLAQRTQLAGRVAEDNRDRKAVYREVALANGHPEWEPRIREIFASQWVDSARSGWWYQAPDGAWRQKP